MEKNQLIFETLEKNNIKDIKFEEQFKQDYVFPVIDNLLNLKKVHPELNFEKILLISLLLLKKIKEIHLETDPIDIVFTATVLWHSVLNRLNDKEYFLQQDLDLKFDRSIAAVRYLRQELGINKRSYENLDHFISELKKSTPLKLKTQVESKDISEYKYNLIKNIITNQIIGRKKAKSAIESSIFLYFNKDRAFTRNEIWYAIEENLDFQGSTPRATFNSDIGRYCINSDSKNKRKPLLFKITNLHEKEHKIKLKENIRTIIDKVSQNMSKSTREDGNENIIEKPFQTWICPLASCNHKPIEIHRNYQNIIDGATYKEVIIHFLQHLQKNNKYFGSVDIYSFFKYNVSNNTFSKQDMDTYPDYGSGSRSLKWKTQIRSILNIMTMNNYLETVDKSLIPEICNKDIKDKRRFRSRRRTQKFYKKYRLFNDLELYKIPIKDERQTKKYLDPSSIKILEKDNNSITFPINYRPRTMVLYNDSKFYIQEEVTYLLPEISTFLKYLEVNAKREFLRSEGFNWRNKFNILNLNNAEKKRKFISLNKTKLNKYKEKKLELDLILNLKDNEIIYKENNPYLKKILNLSFKNYQINKLNEKEFEKILKDFENMSSDIKLKEEYRLQDRLNEELENDLDNIVTSPNEVISTLRELKKLLEEDVLTKDEFNQKKKELLDRL